MLPSSYLFFRGFLASWLMSKAKPLAGCLPMSSVPRLLACREQEQLEESCPAEPRLDFLVVWQHLRFLCPVSYFSMWLSMLSWLCLSFCALCRVIQVSLCFLDWIISELCQLHLTDLVENDVEGVLMYIYWTFFFFLSIPLFLVFKISLMLLEVHCTVEHESC